MEVITSDVGASGANIYPYFGNGNIQILIGEPIKLEHIGEVSIEVFKDNLNKLYSSFRDAAARLEELNKVKVKYPRACLINLGKKAKLPVNLLAEKGVEFERTFSSATAADIICCLYEIQSEVINSDKYKLTDLQRLNMTEAIARVVFGDISKDDIPDT